MDGVAVNSAVSPAGLNWAGETDTTPGVPAIFAAMACTAACGSSAPLASTTMVSGPLKPGPKPSASAS